MSIHAQKPKPNFSRIGTVELAEVRSALAGCDWSRESYRRNASQVHRQTSSLSVFWDPDYRHRNPTTRPAHAALQSALTPIWRTVADYFDDGGYVVRTLFARLPAGAEIAAHTDNQYSLIRAHRIHIPVETNPQVSFFVGGEFRELKTGELWEIDNSQLHAVKNEGANDRIHLIVDWVTPHADDIPWPREQVLEQEQLIAAGEAVFSWVSGRAPASENETEIRSALERMIGSWTEHREPPKTPEHAEEVAAFTTALWLVSCAMSQAGLSSELAAIPEGEAILSLYQHLSGLPR